MRKLISFVVLGLLLAVVGNVSAQGTATAYIVHGIPGLVVDIYVNGKLTLKNFAPDTIAGPLTGPANRSAEVVIVPAGGNPNTPALAATVSFPPGSNVAIVAHLDASGQPTLSIFENNLSTTSGTRLIVRHTAAAPAVDALFFPGTASELRVGPLANGQQYGAELAPGSYTGVLVPTGTATAVYGPLTANLQAGKVYIVYAIGSLSGGTFKTLVQEVKAG
ncbi:MAG TPA: DUF4397 domain-containing protein [Phototrophicaceae bacterium]|nr:DUF4397 domain-containing protein [Phototrophicaceae bacterium]